MDDFSTGEWIAETPWGKHYPDLVQMLVAALASVPRAERDQLWAEAAHRYKAGARPRLTGGVLRRELRPARKPGDAGRQ